MKYIIWQDYIDRYFEIVRWVNPNEYKVMQTNILTREKAEQALTDWRKREGEKSK